MQKQAPTLGRLLVMVGFALSCFGLLLFLWLAFGGPIPLQPKGYRFTTSVPRGHASSPRRPTSASPASPSARSRRSSPTRDGPHRRDRSSSTSSTRRCPNDTKAILRQKTLLGETYVELTPGNKNAGTIPEGGDAAASPGVADRSSSTRSSARSTHDARGVPDLDAAAGGRAHGRGADINDALGNLAPFAEDTDTCCGSSTPSRASCAGWSRNTGEVFDALTERDGQLRSLIDNSNAFFSTTAQRDQRARRSLPRRCRPSSESKTTLERLDQFADNTNPLVTQLRPAARELSPDAARR